MKKRLYLLISLSILLASCSHKTKYNYEFGYGNVDFGEIKNACKKNWIWCDDLLEAARLSNHECRTTDGIKKEQRDNERVVNDAINQKYTRTEWKVSNGFDDCYHFISYDNREYEVKNKFTSTRLGKPTENETIVNEIIIDDDSFLSEIDRNYLRNFYDTIHKKKRPLNAEDKFELYEQKHLSKDTKKDRVHCNWYEE